MVILGNDSTIWCYGGALWCNRTTAARELAAANSMTNMPGRTDDQRETKTITSLGLQSRNLRQHQR